MTDEALKITDYLSIYAAILSSVVFGWNVIRARPTCKVIICPGVHDLDGKVQIGLHISIQNPSPHSVHLSSVSLLYRHHARSLKKYAAHVIRYRSFSKSIGWVHSSLSNYGVKDECPIVLAAGSAHTVFVPQEVLERVLKGAAGRELRVVVQDQLWKDNYSNAMKIDWYEDQNNAET